MNKLITFFILSLLFASCNDRKEQASTTAAESATVAAQKEMLIYGSNECDHCVAFKKKMDSLEVKYTFYDVQVDQSKADEMLRKLEEAKFFGNIAFPVVDVEGKVMVNPPLKTVMTEVKK